MNRVSGEWEEIGVNAVLDPEAPRFFILHGADGDNLVMSTNRVDGFYRYVRVVP